MSGYRRGYSEAHSPYWREGAERGRFDASVPPRERMGPDPEKADSAMYMRGYWYGWSNNNDRKNAPKGRLDALISLK